MEELTVNGIRIAYERRGTGPPLMLLHGALSDSRSWRNQMEELSDDFTVVAWDAPGCGRSSDPPENFRLPDYADCLAVFMNKIGLKKPHVLGLSFGGGLALEYYRWYPSVPSTLILASAYAGWAGSLPPEVVESRLKNGLQQSRLPPRQVAEKWIPTLFSKTAPAAAIEETAAIMSDFHPAGMRNMLRSFAEADLRDVLPRIEIPTLLLYGEADRRSPLKIARKLNDKIPNSTLAVMPGVGHVGNVAAPGIFNSAVRRFLESNQV